MNRRYCKKELKYRSIPDRSYITNNSKKSNKKKEILMKKNQKESTQFHIGEINKSLLKILGLWKKSYLLTERPFNRLIGYLKDINLWVLAYNKISKNTGSLTEGIDNETIDGINLDKLRKLQIEVLNGSFQWGGIKRIYIPKPGKKEKRPLGIPNIRDRIVQEILKIIIEPIFESRFSNNSHGFRPGRGCHTALRMIFRDFKPAIWYIEGDISKCFDTIDHTKLMYALKERIGDKKLLNLIESGIKTQIIDITFKTKTIAEKGTPQGSILSPLLANIMLNKLDLWVLNQKKNFDKGEHPRKFPAYTKLVRAKAKPSEIRSLPRTDPFDENYKRISYVRYADDFIIGIRGSYQEARKIKESLAKFLQEELNLKLSEEKTLISHISEGVKFLGYIIWRKVQFVTQRYESGLRRRKVTLLAIDGDSKKLMNKLEREGFIERKIKTINNKTKEVIQAKPKFAFLRLPQSETNATINSIIRGLTNWWLLAGNRKQLVAKVAYFLRYSIAKVYAAKFKLHDLSKVFKKGGVDLSKPLMARVSSKIVGVTDRLIEEWNKSIGGGNFKRIIPGILYHKYKTIPERIKPYLKADWEPEHVKILKDLISKELQENVNIPNIPSMLDPKELNKQQLKFFKLLINNANYFDLFKKRLVAGVRALGAPCVICGNNENIQMHHIKRISDLKNENPIDKQIIGINRKQIPLCQICHLKAHEGDWRKKPTKNLIRKTSKTK